jgi:NAD-specific glutamate dehydrogenase
VGRSGSCATGARRTLISPAIIAYFAPGVAELRARLPELLSPEDSKSLSVETERLSAAGVPSGLTMRVAGLDALYSALDIVEVANEAKRSVEMVAAVYFALGGRLGLSWLHRQVTALASETHWQTLAKGALLDDLSGMQRSLAAAALKLTPQLSETQALIHAWESQNLSALALPCDPCRRAGGGERRSFDALGSAAGTAPSGALRARRVTRGQLTGAAKK